MYIAFSEANYNVAMDDWIQNYRLCYTWNFRKGHKIALMIYIERVEDLWYPVGRGPFVDSMFLVFLKWFDAEGSILSTRRPLYVNMNTKIVELMPIIREMINWTADVEIDLYEEIKPYMINRLRPHHTFSQEEILSGDIICFMIKQYLPLKRYKLMY